MMNLKSYAESYNQINKQLNEINILDLQYEKLDFKNLLNLKYNKLYILKRTVFYDGAAAVTYHALLRSPKYFTYPLSSPESSNYNETGYILIKIVRGTKSFGKYKIETSRTTHSEKEILRMVPDINRLFFGATNSDILEFAQISSGNKFLNWEGSEPWEVKE